jgi:rhomboid family GlyGly-CTERM serine protease
MSGNSLPSHGGSRALPWLTGLGLAVATLLWLLLGPAAEALVFDRAAIADGEGWRLVTGHLVHSDGQHALWDIGALAIIGYLMERHGRLRMMLAGGIGMLAVDACLWWCMPELERYCGLSGMLNAMFAIALADLWLRYRHPVFAFTALALCIKLMAEIVAGQSLLLDTQWPSVPLTHLAGCLGGLGFLAVEWAFFPANVPKGRAYLINREIA